MVLFVVVIIILILDQWTKYLIYSNLTLHQQIPIIDKVFSITYIRNKGAAFGLFSQSSAGFRVPFFLVISIIAIGVVIYLYRSYAKEYILRRVSLALLLGGAIGNLIDRIRFGEVIDFLDFYWKSFHWPAFNVADTVICIGVGLLLIDMIKYELKADKNNAT